MPLSRTIAVVAAVSLLAGCATTGDRFWPLVDMKDVNQAKFEADVTECQAYAAKAMSAGQGAVAGAVAGAVFGALLGAATKTSRNEGAAVGALVGGTSGAVGAETSQRAITSRCMAGRGYKVLN